jgi:hypothetical protein
MKNIIKQVNLNLIKFMLPWIATLITSLPHSRRLSRFMDWLVVLAEE